MGFMSPIGLYEALIILFIVLVFYLIPLFIGFKLIKHKGLPVGRWMLLTLIFGWPIVIALIFFPVIKEKNLK